MQRAVNFSAAVLVPLTLQGIFVILSKQPHSAAWLGGFGLIVSALAGFLFVVREYRWWSVVVGLAYIPAILIVLFYFSFFVVGAVYGDAL